MTVPEIVDYDLPVAGAFHNCCIVSIRKAYPGHAQKVMHALWGLGMLSLTKAVVVVDEWVDVHDYDEVFFRVGANVDPKRDVLISEGRSTTSTTRRRASSTAGRSGSTRRTKGLLKGRASGRRRSR
jgi:UbiD family decarboxylase